MWTIEPEKIRMPFNFLRPENVQPQTPNGEATPWQTLLPILEAALQPYPEARQAILDHIQARLRSKS
jgi:hypothetical protein